MTTNQSSIRFRMRTPGETVDQDGVVTDADGRQWGDVPALQKRIRRLEAEAAHDLAQEMFAPAPAEGLSDEPTPEGGTLDALADGIWARHNEK